jgi:hypothetical protein
MGSAGPSSTCVCDPIACGPGYIQVPNDSGCCSHCELDQDACEQQSADYLLYRTELIAQFSSYTCVANTDCIAFYIQNSCSDACLLTVTGARRAVIDGLNNYATSNCNEACLANPKPSCGDPPLPACREGVCVAPR